MKTAAVIGGGIVGLSTAVRLQKNGFAVTLLDPDVALTAASWGNAGHIAIEQAEPLASWPLLRSAPRRLFTAGGALSLPLGDMHRWLPFVWGMAHASSARHFAHGRAALRSLLASAMPAWRRLLADTGRPDLLRETGHFVVWEHPASAAAGLAKWRAADIGTARFHEASDDELAQLAAVMHKPPAGAIRFENSGQIADLHKLAETLRATLHAAGGQLVQGKVRNIEIGNGIASAVMDGGGPVSSDIVLVAAGVRSRALLEPLGLRVPMIAERGYHIQMPADRWPDLPPVVFEDRSMIVTRFDSGLRAASFVELGNADSPPDPRKWHRLRKHVQTLGLPCGAPAAQWMGARPTLPDYLPAIGRSRVARNLLYAFGHQHLGLTLGALTGELMTQVALDAPASVNLEPFDIERFSTNRKTP